MSPRRPPHNILEDARPDQGFVLPYVLVVIAILSIAGTIAAQRLSRSADVISNMRMKASSDRILQSAEAAASYSLLTSNPQRGGYDISPDSPIVWEFGVLSADGKTPLSDEDAAGTSRDFWPANGGVRRYILGAQNDQTASNIAFAPNIAFVRLQDAAGLVSINQGNPQRLTSVLKASGASTQQARDMISALQDYKDIDDTRRDNGAETRDYRRSNLALPSNAPLRNMAELSNIWGWEDALTAMDTLKIADLTTVFGISGFRESFALSEHRAILGLQANSLLGSRQTGLTAAAELKVDQTSGYARFTFYAPRPDGRYDKRIVDIERTLANVNGPYRRHWVYDTTVLESDLEKNPDIPQRRDNNFNLDGLKDVVHASPSAR